jgi:hypothetical protein
VSCRETANGSENRLAYSVSTDWLLGDRIFVAGYVRLLDASMRLKLLHGPFIHVISSLRLGTFVCPRQQLSRLSVRSERPSSEVREKTTSYLLSSSFEVSAYLLYIEMLANLDC